MGRNAKPIQLHLAEGNPNRLTKAQIEDRLNSQISLGEPGALRMPDFVRENKVAAKKWRELVKQYEEAAENNVDLVSSTDSGILARYCLTFAEWVDLVRLRKDAGDIKDVITRSATVLELTAAINKKLDLLLKMEDRLFLNPLAKVRNVPKRQREQRDEFGEMFDA